MDKAGQTAVQERDNNNITVPPYSSPTRGPAERAVLVSERHAVWDQPAPSIEQAIVADAGPSEPVPLVWTWDLVHARLLSVAAICRRLPRAKLPPGPKSFLGDFQPQDSAPGRQRVLTDQDTQCFDFTMKRLNAWSEIDRAVIQGIMFDHKLDVIVKIIAGIVARHGGKAIKRSAVHKRYRKHTATMADEWNDAEVPIDEATREAWLNAASK